MAVSKFYKIITPSTSQSLVQDNRGTGAYGSYTNFSWYQNLVYGSAQRASKYKEYDLMDCDTDVARALDIIAEEITGNNPKGELPLSLKITDGPERTMTNTESVTLKAALKTWCKLQDWENRLFTTSRNLIKYGDCFFIRPKKIGKKWAHVHPRNVVGAAVNDDDITDIKQWEIQSDTKLSNNGMLNNNYLNALGGDGTNASMAGSSRFEFDDVVWFSMYNDMSDEAPFGVSILKSIFKTFKQKELLEDAIIIYRVQRAPERRVFYIDMGATPAHLIPASLETFKNEIRQKKVPSINGGKSQVDAGYNPQSMNEDYFLALRKDSGGSRIETLPGGQNLGELQDLDYFYKKMWRGLRIPESYMNNSVEGSSVASDGKVGIAYQQEIKFTLYIERLQRSVEKTMDEEFKRFLHDCKIKIDSTMYEIVLPEPSNYAKSREQAMDAELLSNLVTADGLDFFSKRFVIGKYGRLSKEELLLNERQKREEAGLAPDGGKKDLPMIYNPDAAEARGFEGGLGGSGGEDFFAEDGEGGEGDDLDLGGDEDIDSADEAAGIDNSEKDTSK